jgi:hypothetical protein
VEPEGAGFALVCDAAISLDEVEAVWPPGVGSFDVIVETVDDCGKLDTEFAHANTRYRSALLLIAGTAEQHLVANIALHLPYVSRVRLENVDGIEIYLALILLG